MAFVVIGQKVYEAGKLVGKADSDEGAVRKAHLMAKRGKAKAKKGAK